MNTTTTPTHTETVIDRYYGTLTEAHNHPQGIGPVIVEVVKCQRLDGNYRPSFSVRLNGRHAFGFCGYAQDDGTPPASSVTPSFVIRHDDPIDPALRPPKFAPGVDPAAARRVSGFYRSNGWTPVVTFRGRVVATRHFDHLAEWHLIIAIGEGNELVTVKFPDNPLGVAMLHAAREDAVDRCGGRP